MTASTTVFVVAATVEKKKKRGLKCSSGVKVKLPTARPTWEIWRASGSFIFYTVWFNPAKDWTNSHPLWGLTLYHYAVKHCKLCWFMQGNTEPQHQKLVKISKKNLNAMWNSHVKPMISHDDVSSVCQWTHQNLWKWPENSLTWDL